MPELSRHTSAICPDLVDFATSINGHRVTFNRFNPGKYQCNWNCDCKGFLFRRTCKHIALAEKEQCQYDQQIEGAPNNGHCPCCNKPVTYQTIAI